MVAEHLAVIGGEHDDRVLARRVPLERLEHAPELGVDLADRPEVGRPQLPEVVRGPVPHRALRTGDERRAALFAPDEVDVGVHRRGRLPAPFARELARRDVRGRHLPVERRRRDERRVRPQEAQVREPAVRVVAQPLPFPPAQELVDDERRRRVRRVVDGGPAGRRVVDAVRGAVRMIGRQIDAARPRPGTPLPLVLAERQARVEAGQDTLVVAQPRVPRVAGARIDRDVGVPEQDRRVARAPGRERDVVVPGVERGTVAADAVAHRVEPGVERGARRRARGGVGEVAGEAHAAGGQRVEVGRAHVRVTRRRQAVAAPLVGGDQQDVQRARHRSGLRQGRRAV